MVNFRPPPNLTTQTNKKEQNKIYVIGKTAVRNTYIKISIMKMKN